MMSEKPRGFIALISAIIIAAILLLVTVSGGLIGIHSRFNILDSESKERSLALADACIDTLLIQLSVASAVTPGTYPVGSDSCQILSNSRPYQVQGIFNNTYTNVRVSVDPDTFAITSWEEVANF